MALIATESLASCPECGAVVPTPRVQMHEEWHSEHDQPEQVGIDLSPWPAIDEPAPSSL